MGSQAHSHAIFELRFQLICFVIAWKLRGFAMRYAAKTKAFRFNISMEFIANVTREVVGHIPLESGEDGELFVSDEGRKSVISVI